MAHVFYSQSLATAHQKIWSNPKYQRSMATWERRFYTVDGEEVEGNLESAAAELEPAELAAKYPDAEYRGEGVLTRTAKMGAAAR